MLVVFVTPAMAGPVWCLRLARWKTDAGYESLDGLSSWLDLGFGARVWP
jgi:hypothetical protein